LLRGEMFHLRRGRAVAVLVPDRRIEVKMTAV
jgi:hypothetical protein